MVYAGFWRRFAAVVIDALITLIPAIVIGMILPYFGWLVVGLLYKPFFESSSLMATPGKFFMGMVVTDETGARITFRQSLTRYLLSLVSGACMCIGHFFNLFTAKRQTFHDLVAGTVVIQREQPQPADWLNIWTEEFKRVVGSGDSISASGAPTAKAGTLETLENLHKLFQQGVISEQEYNEKKAELLKKL